MKEVEKTRTVQVQVLPEEWSENQDLKTETREEKYTVTEMEEIDNPIVKDMLELTFWPEILEPYFDGSKIIQYERPKEIIEIKMEIGQIIEREVYEGNRFGVLADLTEAVVWLAYIITPVVGKDPVKLVMWNLKTTLKQVSDIRVSQWLSPYDLSFLD